MAHDTRSTPNPTRPDGPDPGLDDSTVWTGPGVVTAERDPPTPDPDLDDGTVTLALPSGREISVQPADGGDDHLRVRGVDGTVELHVRLTGNGPVLQFESADLELSSPGAVRVRCEEYHVAARKGIVQETGGSFIQSIGGAARVEIAGDSAVEVGGDSAVEVEGDFRTRARAIETRAMRGDVRLKANDDVRVRGERIRLNC